MKKINVTNPSMPEFEDYTEEIKDLWDTRWLTNMGVKHQKLEEKLKEYLKVENISLFANGHLALEYAIESLGLEGEVITTPFTFASTTHAIARKGLTPIFCDIKKDDCTIDSKKIEELITDKTSAIIPVHVYGNICDIEKIEDIAKKYNLKVIYDAAHAFGVTVSGQGIGAFGDASIFSFHATKVFNTVEGGAVTYSEDYLRDKIEKLKNFGISGPESIGCIGGNAKMNELQAAMGLCNLKKLDSDIERRKTIVKRYTSNLEGKEGIRLVEKQNEVQSNHAYFPVIFENYKKTRDEVLEELNSNNVNARKYFYPITNEFTCYKEKYGKSKTPIAKYVSERVLTLPLYADLELKDIDRICEVILR